MVFMNTILVLPVMVSGLGMRPGKHLQIGLPSLEKTVQHPLISVVLVRIRDILVRIWMRIRIVGSAPLTSDEQIRIRTWIRISTKIAVTFRMQK